MDSTNQAILDGLKKAIQLESDGHHFYRMAAQSTSDPKGQEVFAMLAREEAEHARFLRNHYDSFLRSGKPDPDAHLPEHGNLEGEHPVFSDKVNDNVKSAHLEMSALAIGIQLELNSIKFYQSQADRHGDEEIRRFFNELVEWERGHYEALSRQQASLKEDYWAAGGFSPF